MWVERSEPNPARGNGGLERAASLQKVEDFTYAQCYELTASSLGYLMTIRYLKVITLTG